MKNKNLSSKSCCVKLSNNYLDNVSSGFKLVIYISKPLNHDNRYSLVLNNEEKNFLFEAYGIFQYGTQWVSRIKDKKGNVSFKLYSINFVMDKLTIFDFCRLPNIYSLE